MYDSGTGQVSSMALPFFVRRLCWLLLCALTPANFSWAAPPPWIEVRSPHFSVYTDAGEKRGRETALQFEKMRAVFSSILGSANSAIPEAPKIVAFRSAEEMRQFAPLWNGQPTQIAGFFQVSGERRYIVVDLSADEPWRVVLHEYSHQLLTHSSSRKFDPWFSEGFAGFFSTIETDNKETRIGTVPGQDFETLQRDGMFKVSDLFRIKQSSRTYNENSDRRSVFYAEATLLVHYLYDASLLPAAFKYFELAAQEKTAREDLIQQAFGMTPDALDKEFRAYVNAGRYRTYVVPGPQLISRDQFSIRELTATEQGFLVADLHLHSPDYQQRGLEELRQLVQSAPRDGLALRELGATYVERKQYAEARDCFRRAAASEASDARLHYYSALLISREKGFSNIADLTAMKKELEASLALDASNADTLSLLAFVQTFRGEGRAGLESMKGAMALKPGDVTIRFNLAQLYLHNRMTEPAIELLKNIDSSGNEFLEKRVAETLRDALAMKVASAAGTVSVPGFLMLTP
jgi:tetratricopeptide (TPR) repeat protein